MSDLEPATHNDLHSVTLFLNLPPQNIQKVASLQLRQSIGEERWVHTLNIMSQNVLSVLYFDDKW